MRAEAPCTSPGPDGWAWPPAFVFKEAFAFTFAYLALGFFCCCILGGLLSHKRLLEGRDATQLLSQDSAMPLALSSIY